MSETFAFGLVLIWLTGALALSSNAAPAHPGAHESTSNLTPEDRQMDRAIAAHIAFLADDLLEGRGTGSAGYDIAARYVAAQFQQLGLRPGGVSNTWFQTVPLLESKLVPDTAR